MAWAAKQERRRRCARTERQVQCVGLGDHVVVGVRREAHGTRQIYGHETVRAVGGITAASAQDEVSTTVPMLRALERKHRCEQRERVIALERVRARVRPRDRGA